MPAPLLYLKQANAKRPAMGLEDLGLCVFENAASTYSPAVVNGVVQHGIENPKDIALVEQYYNRKFDRAEDLQSWANLILQVEHSQMPIDPKNPEDILRLGILKVQGKLAPSIDEQSNPNANYVFVLVNEGAQQEEEASIYKKRRDAHGLLKEISEKSPKYMIALAKYLLNFQGGSNSENAALLKLSEMIDGKLHAKKAEAIDQFVNSLDPIYGGRITKEEITLRVDIQRAITQGIIRRNDKGIYYNPAVPGSDYGNSPDQIYTFLSQIVNSDHLGTGTDTDAPYSVRYQLKKMEI